MAESAQRLFEGDTALVTGAANGIGRGIAEALAREGVRVLGADLKGSDLDVDLSRPGEAKRLAAEAIAKLGRVSIFVHSASPRRREEDTALEVSEETWRAMQEVNLNAGFLLGQALGRHMREQKIRGRMLYITSLHAYAPRNLPHYSAAKAGQTMLVREFARALGPDGIRVNAIAPGAIPGGGFDAAKNPGLLATIPMGRFGTPADIAAMALAVLSERFGAYVTGTTIAVDGGIALHNWIERR
ncbi:MAG: SDR family NAD(P)-dependent oxidoreductase [Proteobacteria bacterium]|nr:SDR family NAD(P)-dependent oxidoreductase [Pseudomonadota bacterium]